MSSSSSTLAMGNPMVRAATLRVSRPVRPACWAEASRRTPTSRPGLGRSAYLRPRTVAVPEVAGVRPTMTRMVVDFPAPFGPRNPVTRPGLAVKETSSTARRPPYVLVSAVTSIMGATLPPRGGRPHRGAVPSRPLPDPEGFSGVTPALGTSGVVAALAGRAYRDLVRRRLPVVLHRQAAPGGGARRLRAQERRRGGLPLLRAGPDHPRGAGRDDRGVAGAEVRHRRGGRPGADEARRRRGRLRRAHVQPRRRAARPDGRRAPAPPPGPRRGASGRAEGGAAVGVLPPWREHGRSRRPTHSCRRRRARPGTGRRGAQH